MAWPSYVTDGEVATAAQYNALVDSDASWGGSVNAGGYIITNLASIVAAPSAVLDVSAGGFSVKGDVAASGKLTVTSNPTDGFPLTVSTAGGPTFNVQTGAGVAHVQLRTSDGWLYLGKTADATRGIFFIAPPGQQESINPSSGRLSIGGALDITADLTVAGAMQITGAVTVGSIVATGNIKAATLTVTGAASAASLATSGVLTVGTDANVGGTLTVATQISSSNADGYLHLGPQWVRAIQLQTSAGLISCSTDWSKFVSITIDAANNIGLIGGTALAYVASTQNFQCNGWLRTVGATGMFVYSPDLSRYLQINCANTGNPVITSSTAALTVSANMTFTGVASFAGSVTISPGNLTVSGAISAGGRVAASVDLYVGPSSSGTGYMQFCNNGQFGDVNPWIYSSTGILCCQVAFYMRAGQALYAWNSANSQYISFGSGGVGSTTGNFPITCACTISGILNCSANVGINNGAMLYIYNTANSASLTVGFGGTANPVFGSTSGAVMFSCNCGCYSPGGFVSYSPDSSRYGQWSCANAGHPTLYSSTGTMVFTSAPYLANVSMTCVPAASPGINISIPATNFVGWQISAPSLANTTMTAGISNNIQGGNQPYLYSNTATLNIQANLLYVTGAVSATAHQTHGSGTDIADVYESFYRDEPHVVVPPKLLDDVEVEPPVIEGVIPVDAWTLAPADDGLHILVKRSETEVLETVLPWSQFKAAPQPAAGKN